MLAFIVLILKIIGILLAVILTLIALILFVPVRYKAEGSYYEELKGKGKISWLLHIISFHGEYDKELKYGLRIFGILVGSKKSDEELELDVPESEEPATDEPEADALEPEKPEAEAEAEPAEPVFQEPVAEEPVLEIPEKEEKSKKASASKKKTTKKKNRVTIQSICDKLKLWKSKYESFQEFIHKEENINTFRLVKKQVFALIKHILPRKIKGRIHFGFEDPYTTGQVLACISPFYGLYAKGLEVIPDFLQKILEGELKIKGRIRLATILAMAIRVFMDKNFRILLKKWRAL